MTWAIRVNRMAVAPWHPTPFCAMAVCGEYAVNAEGATEEEAIAKVKLIANDALVQEIEEAKRKSRKKGLIP